jgi:ATP-dependent Clp protease ATP-binding subunit ClpC
LAEDVSRKARCYFVGTEHLFLAVASQAPPEVGRLLAQHGIALDEAVARVRKLLRYWEPEENWSGLLHHTHRVRRIVQRAKYLAERESGGGPQPGHFLTALLEEPMGHTARAIRGAPTGPPPARPSKTETDQSPQGMQLRFEPADQAPGQSPEAGTAGESVLEHFGRDLTRLAEAGQLNPFIGGETQLRNLIRTLTRKTKPNPIIVGEPGTGKTALVEGLAQKIVGGKVPQPLKNARIVELSLSSLVAGTQYRGEFEKRVELILDELAQRSEVILFLDEFHLAVGAGSASGSMDVANILKPALARGQLRCIGATTLRDYRKYVEVDSGLTRRFQTIILEQPDEATTLRILEGVKERFEKHHGVTISAEALSAAVRLSSRYESDRRQPDKSIDLLDDACTRVTLESVDGLAEAASEEGLSVTVEHVARAVSERTGIPVSSLTTDERDRLANLQNALRRTIQGQDEAIELVTNALRQIRLGLREDERPQAVFLFTGPTGVGKTALAECLAAEFFGLPEALVRIDLSEYTEAHNVSRLIGAPPGYVGHDEQGQLTKALKVRPFSLVLLDEIEKAHPQVCDVFLQVFGSGRLTDGRGDVVDCRQAIFVMTGNLGAEAYDEEGGFGFRPSIKDKREQEAQRVEAVREACLKHFRPEFVNRLDRIVCFHPMTPPVMRTILDRLVDQMRESLEARGVVLEVTDEVRAELVLQAGTEQGVPPLKRLLREQVLNRVVEIMVSAPAGETLHAIAAMGERGIEINTEAT